jgi:hypothetical protein
MPLDQNKSESERLSKRKNRIIYSNYLSIKTHYESGTYGYPPKIVAGTGSSLESSALENIINGQLNTTVSEQSKIIADK